jgi:3-oxoacyl-[acyl-carrier-protein] synthase II
VTAAVVTGCSLHLPGVESGGALPDPGPACPPDQAGSLLGRKGLLMKEPATRLALCAVHRALGLADGQRITGPVRTDTAVVACSNLGNVETVTRVTGEVARGDGRRVSPLAAPNASSNVLAATVARWFRCGGPNLMVCSGRRAGYDALRLALLTLASGRARRVVVVGAEPDDPTARRLYGRGGTDASLRAGAACLVLSRDGAGPRLVLTPEAATGVAVVARVGPPPLDPVAAWGDCYGAQQVVNAVLAVWLATARGATVWCGEGPAGAVLVSPPQGRGST